MVTINVITLQNEIIKQPKHIEKVLSKLGHKNIRDRGKYYQFRSLNGDNDAGCALYKDTLSYQGFSHSESGNIFTLVQDEKHCSFPQALDYIARWIGIRDDTYIKPTYPFSGFYKKLIKQQSEPENCLKVYSQDILPRSDNYSLRFFKDGIDFQTQEKFGVRYSHEDDSILIPIYDYSNQLVGVKARNNSDIDYSKRWYAFAPYQKTQVLYGWNINYKQIIKENIVYVCESEKGCLQLDTMGIHVGLGIAGHNISDTQVRYLKALNTEKIIVMFDEGLSKEEIEYEAKKLIVNNKLFKNKVGYIYDGKHQFLTDGSKDSPTDNGYKTLKNLINNCTVWIGEENEKEE